MHLDDTRICAREVLIVDSDDEVRREVRRALGSSGLACREATTGAECLQEVRQSRPDLVVLGLYLTDQSGVGLCRLLRESPETERLPIVVVSAQAGEMDRIVAFESGVDDFVARPFYPSELRARVEAILRNVAGGRSPDASGSLQRGPILLDDRLGDARVEGRPVGLTSKEFALLRELATPAGRVVRRRQLIDRVWGEGEAPTDRAIDAHIKSIRRKLGPARDFIETVRGVGYRFAEDAG